MLLSEKFLKNIELDEIERKKIIDVLPTAWNHLKKQYVAIISGDSPHFISKITNSSRSGCNADLEYDYEFEKGEIILVKDGSHKHQTQSYYIAISKTNCRFICEIEGDEVVGHNFKEDSTTELIKKEIERKKKAFRLSEKRTRVMKLAWTIYREFKEENGETASFSLCLKTAWKFESKWNMRGGFGTFKLFLIREETEDKRKQEKRERNNKINNLLKEFTGLEKIEYWNKKIYKRNREYNIYIDNTCYNLTEEQTNELQKIIKE